MSLAEIKVEGAQGQELVNAVDWWSRVSASVTRLGDLLQFGQLFKACDNNYFAQTVHILRQF